MQQGQKLINKVNFVTGKKMNQPLSLEPYLHVKQVNVKQIRSKLLNGLNQWMEIPIEILQIIENIINLMYEGLVIQDDVFDHGLYTRGVPSAHRIFGIDRTFISSNTVFILALNETLKLKSLEAVEIYVEEFLKFYESMSKEIYNQLFTVCPTYDEYVKTAKEKTQVSLDFPVRLMKLFSNSKQDYSKFVELLSLYYQFLNDYSSLHSDGNWHRKGLCDDISEGKFTYAMIHAINTGTVEGQTLHNILRLKTNDIGLKKYCLYLMKKLGSIDFAKNTAILYEQKLRNEINRLGPNPQLQEVVDIIKQYQNDDDVDDSFVKETNLLHIAGCSSESASSKKP